VLNDEEIEIIKLIAQNKGLKKGVLSQGDVLNENTRKSSIAWIGCDKITQGIFDKIWDIFYTVNDDYQFDIDYLPALQYTEYDSKTNDSYDYHMDIGDEGHANIRKLSIIIMLTSPEEYEGGTLELFCGGNRADKFKLKRGKAIVFPSYMLHKVTEVTDGKRSSLVGWVQGKESFK
jgi:PKHD-type hydroxylase